jgi:PAS domain-containing protein
MRSPELTYEIDSKWRIVRASEAFCRAFRCSEAGLIGRDIRELLRRDWRPDFRAYIVRALVGVGDYDAIVPMVAPCGEPAWFRHTLEPMIEDGLLEGYRATIVPLVVHEAAPAPRWWNWRPQAPTRVWDFDAKPLAKAS